MAVVRFEGLPGELLQIDWGEQRQMKFSKPALMGQNALLLRGAAQIQPLDVGAFHL